MRNPSSPRQEASTSFLNFPVRYHEVIFVFRLEGSLPVSHDLHMSIIISKQAYPV